MRELAKGLVLHEIVIERILEGSAPAGGDCRDGDFRLKAEYVLRVLRSGRRWTDLLLLLKSFEREIAAALLAGGSAADVSRVLILRPPPLRPLFPLALRLRGCRLLGREGGVLGFQVLVGGFLEPEALLSPYLLMLLFKMNLA